jgi:hypothetical protein
VAALDLVLHSQREIDLGRSLTHLFDFVPSGTGAARLDISPVFRQWRRRYA